MKILFSGLLLWVCAVQGWAQNGSYFLTHHSPSEENFDNVCFDMVQDDHGIMYFAVKAGILEFDGREWDLMPGAGAIYGLTRNVSGDIFWVGAKGFGRLGQDERGFKQIKYLSDSFVTNVFQALVVGDTVYFLSESTIFVYRAGEERAGVVLSGNVQNMFTGMFELFGELYVQTERNTTFRVENNKLVYVNLNFSGNVLFHSRIEDTYLLGTSDNRVYTCGEDLTVKQVSINDQPYGDTHVVVGGTWVNKNLLALGTLRGGVMLLDPETGERDQIIDYSTGLPDNEVFSLMADANQNIWVAHEYGFTQISPGLPFRSFSYYDGLEGNMLCAYSFQNQVYVGTSLGLYKLDKDEIYDEVVSYVEVDLRTPKGSGATGQQLPPSGTAQPEVKEDAPSRKRGFFNFLRRNREKNEKDEESKEPDNAEADHPNASVVRREKRIDRVLRSSQHVYKKVSGIDSKIAHLVEMEGKLVAAGLEGVFEIKDLEAVPIMHSPTRYVYASSTQQNIIASTYNDEIWSLQYTGEWQGQILINNLGDQIDYIFEGAENEWWLCGLNRIYQLQLAEEGIRNLQTIDLLNPNFERTVGLYSDSGAQIIFVNNGGFFRFQRDKKLLEKIDSLPDPHQYFAIDHNILYRDQHRWSMLGENGWRNNLQLLNLFHSLRFITPDQDAQNLWMISGNNELLKFDGHQGSAIQNRYPLFLKSVQNNTVKIADFNKVQIDQMNSSVMFEVVQPDFINPRSIEFRYFLEGMHQHWSDWSSSNNKITFPYLPPGGYKLRVEARNIFGKISALAPLPFEVIPPYWKQSWFYALEFIIFASLVILSFRLSTRYRIISRLLSLITIIMLIEFIQTVIGSSIISDDTPVVEFFIQVVVAFVILPVEGFLRNLMLRSLDSDSKLYRLIAAGEVPTTLMKKASRKRKLREPL